MFYVRDSRSGAAHIWDYLGDRTDHGLCGHPYGDIRWEGTRRPGRVCRACQASLPAYELMFFKERAALLEQELGALRAEVEAMKQEAKLRARAPLDLPRERGGHLVVSRETHYGTTDPPPTGPRVVRQVFTSGFEGNRRRH